MKNRKIKFDMNKLLLLFALVPLFCAGIIISVLLVKKSSSEVKNATSNSMLALIEGSGTGFDHYFATSEETVLTFTKSPIVVNFLKNPEDPQLTKEAQQYTVDFFGALDGWEGIYIADWNSKVLTHPAPPVVGRVMREGDALESLRNSMLNSDGVYDTGIITSPASGELIISLYAPVYDGDTPIGYVGAGTYVKNIAELYTDTSSLNLDSAYTYFVDKEGIIIYHPTEEKIGTPIENEVVAGLVERMQKGEHPESQCVEYRYNKELKYAAYYVGVNENYIAVLTAGEADVLSGCQDIMIAAIIIVLVLFVIFAGLAVVLAKKVSRPIGKITEAVLETSEGSLTADTDVNSFVYEVQHLIDATKTLQTNLVEIIDGVKNTSEAVNTSALSVAEMASLSADSCEQVNTAVDELAQGSMSIAESCSQLATEVNTMSQCCDDITDEVGKLSDASKEIMKANDEAKEYMVTALEASEKSAVGANEIAEIVAETNEKIKDINQAVDIILSIATQTNLLSLNASIEAARAGEAGNGFAIVANEISNLATQSSNSANTIQGIVKTITEMSAKSVEHAKEIKTVILEQNGCITDTNSKFEELSKQVTYSIESINAIAGKVDTLSEVKASINTNVSDLSAVSEESAASTQESTASINSISQSVQDISSNSEELKSLSDNLYNQVQFFH